MPSIPHYDVVVAGAGPAGCASAITLKQAGLTVCLVDKVTDGVRKVGESLPGAISRLLNRLGIDSLQQLLPEQHVKRCVANASAWGSNQWIYQDGLLNPEGGGWHVNRHCFDAALRQKAALLDIPFYATRIAQIKPIPDVGADKPDYLVLFDNRTGLLTEGIQTNWLIDATGRSAFISRKFSLSRVKIGQQMAAVCWVKAIGEDQDQTTRIKSVPHGWWYTARLPDGSRVISFHGLPAQVATLVKCPAAFFEDFNEAALLPYAVSDSSLIEMKAMDASMTRSQTVATNGFVCVGDAALALDPLASQGVFFALYSGIKGAEAIAKSSVDPSIMNVVLQEYQMQINRVFEANQRSRMYFYTSELRYVSESYWQGRMSSK